MRTFNGENYAVRSRGPAKSVADNHLTIKQKSKGLVVKSQPDLCLID